MLTDFQNSFTVGLVVGGAKTFDVGSGQCGAKLRGWGQKKIDSSGRLNARNLKYR